MDIIACQPSFRQALPNIFGPLEYREERAMVERIIGGRKVANEDKT